MAIMDSFFEDYSGSVKAMYQLEDGKIDLYEQEKYGTSHAEVGAKLAKKWGLEKIFVLPLVPSQTR